MILLPTPLSSAAGLSSSSFFKHHSAIHDTIKGRLVPSYLTKMCPILSQEFYTSLLDHGRQGEMDLMDFVRDAMFEAVVRQLFGHDNVPREKVCTCVALIVWRAVDMCSFDCVRVCSTNKSRLLSCVWHH